MPAGGSSGGGASSGAVRAGGAFVELFTKDALLQKGLAKAKASVMAYGNFFAKTGKALTVVAAGVFAPLALLAKGGGGFISQQSSDAAEAFSKAIDQIGSSVQDALLPALEKSLPAIRDFQRLSQENPKFIQYLAGVSAGILAIGIGAKIIAPSFGIAVAAVKVLLATLGLFFSPLGILTAGIAAIGVGFLALSPIGKKVGEQLSSFFGEFGDAAKMTIEGVVKALEDGNIEGAFRTVVEGLKLIWLELTAFMQQQWFNVIKTLEETRVGIAKELVNDQNRGKFPGIGLVAATTASGAIAGGAIAGPPGALVGGIGGLIGGAILNEQLKDVRKNPNEVIDELNAGAKRDQAAREAELNAQQQKSREAIEAQKRALMEAPLQGRKAPIEPHMLDQLQQFTQAGIADNVKGAFTSSNFAQRLGIGDKVNEKMLTVQKAILDAVKALTEVVKGGKGLTFVGSKL